MEESHRLLRYVLPGLSFFVEGSLLLLLILPNWTLETAEYLAGVGLSAALIALLGSGGFGFLFSTLHHVTREVSLLGGVDHRAAIARLRSRDILQLLNARTGEPLPSAAAPDRREAWAILNAVWHQHLSPDTRIGRAEGRTKSLSDIAHSTGTARVGAFFAGIVPFAVAWGVGERSSDVDDIARFISAVVLALVFLVIHHIAYSQCSATAERVIAEVFEDTLSESALKDGNPIRTHVVIRES